MLLFFVVLPGNSLCQCQWPTKTDWSR